MDHQVTNIHDDLIARCRAGDRRAFKRIYELYSKAMYNVAYRITADEDDASDVLQEAFISAFDHLGFYRGNATFGSWLKRIVVNKALRTFAELSGPVMVVGARRRVAVWARDRWDRRMESIPEGPFYRPKRMGAQ